MKNQWQQYVERDYIVIFENSTFEFGSDYKNQELRTISLGYLSDDKEKIEKDDWVDDYSMIFYPQYRLGHVNKENSTKKYFYPLSMKVDNFRFIDACHTWYGLIPQYGLMLNLICEPSFPPCWQNEKGDDVCKTIWWKEGAWTHKHYDNGSIMGEGFVIIMHKDNFNELISKINKPFLFRTKIIREVYDCRSSQFKPIDSKEVIDNIPILI
jgi:hypothetical protein